MIKSIVGGWRQFCRQTLLPVVYKARANAIAWLIKQRVQLNSFAMRRVRIIEFIVWTTFLAVLVVVSPRLHTWLAPIASEEQMESLRGLISTVGGAMIGATAIVTSFILFAMQVNVDRLPHSLFRRFSTDPALLGIFGLSFAASVAGTSLTLIADARFFALLIVLAVVSLALVLRLLLHAYRRSLKLINPIEQLTLIHADEDRRMRMWERRIHWLMPLVRLPQDDERVHSYDPARDGLQTDLRRMVVLQSTKSWDRTLRDAITQSASYARRAGERGDLEVSAHALQTIASLNQVYIRVKGDTFYSHSLLIDNPFVTDGLINTTLEELRRLRAAAVDRRDERQLEQLFRALLGLVKVYAVIRYPGPSPTKTHALLALGYLERAVEAALRADLVDTTMIGLGVLGDSAEAFLRQGQPSEVISVATRISNLGSTSLVREELRPVTLVAVEQLSRLTISLLKINDTETGYALRGVRDCIFQLAHLMLIVPDQPGRSTDSTYLGPFFSASNQSFLALFVELGNQISDADAESEPAAIIAENIQEWAESAYRPLRQILDVTVASRSSFMIDLMYWITTCSEVLLVVSQAPATSDRAKEKLENHASWLFNSLSFIPQDEEVARWIGAYSFMEHIFDFGMMSLRHGWQRGFNDAWKLLFNWSFGAGRNLTGWGTLEEGLKGLAALALHPQVNRAGQLLREIGARIGRDGDPPREIYERAAASLREDAENLWARELESRSIERVLTRNPRPATRALMLNIAALLSPDDRDPALAE